MSQLNIKIKSAGRRLASYFFQGLLLIAPASFTIYAILKIFDLVDSNTNAVFEQVFHFKSPGLGIVVFVSIITVVGFIGSNVLIQPILNIIESLLEKTPLVKDIYSSFKDFISAFLSNKKKFDKPVLIEIGKGSGVFRMGFITDLDLSEFNIREKVAVYCPLSYTVSGHLFIVNTDQVSPLENVSSSQVMKYIISGGITEVEERK